MRPHASLGERWGKGYAKTISLFLLLSEIYGRDTKSPPQPAVDAALRAEAVLQAVFASKPQQLVVNCYAQCTRTLSHARSAAPAGSSDYG